MKITRQNTTLIVIDIKEKFTPVIKNMDYIIDNVVKLVKSFQIMKVPIIVTEQYSRGLGKTVGKIRKELEDYKPIEKVCFNCFDNKTFLDRLKKRKIKNLILCGIEAHVCVTQTLIDALSKGFNVHIVADAVSSRKESILQ